MFFQSHYFSPIKSITCAEVLSSTSSHSITSFIAPIYSDSPISDNNFNCAASVSHLNINILHTSASLVIQENADPDVLHDLKIFFDRTVPMDNRLYKHTTEGKDDMPAHIKSTLTNNQLTLSIKNKKLMLGTWQALYLFEHRIEKHTRILSHHLMGE